MECITVRNKDELDSAQKNKTKEIIVEGELATKLHDGKNVVKLSAASIAVIGAAIATVPLTGGLSTLAIAPIAAIAVMSGAEVALIIAVVFVGLGLLLAIWKGYDEVVFDVGPPPKMILRRKDN